MQGQHSGLEKYAGMAENMQAGMVSVITPCYNGAEYISGTIESVLAQTYPDWEMIIVDDGSTDETASVVGRYSAEDTRIHFIQQANKGSAAARNEGIRSCRGQYIALLDADDIWTPFFLQSQIDYMKEKNAVCVYCSYGMIDSHSNDILRVVKAKPVVTVKDMLVRNRIGCLSGLYDSSKYGKIFLREELNSIRDDYAYWLDVVRLEGKAYGNPEVLAKYRVLPQSTTGNKLKLIRKQFDFYHRYLQLGLLRSVMNVIRWGIAGVGKFGKL